MRANSPLDKLNRDRATALRRAVLGIYAGGLAAGTHWPRLELGDPQHPADKMLHFIAFGGLAVCLHQARYFRRSWTLLLFGVAWAVVDEVSQLLPGLGRSFSLQDIWAGASGVVLAVTLCWATRPRGHLGARLRRERLDSCLDALLARPTGWMALASSAALGGVIGVPTAILIDGASDDPTPFQAAVVGGLLGAATVGGAMLLAGVRGEERRAHAEGRWTELPSLTWPDVIKACTKPICAGIATLVALFVAWAMLLVLRRDLLIAADLLHWLDSLSKGMTTVLDATAVGLVAAITIDRCRARLALRLDEAHLRCLACGQDLRATPAPSGHGRCGECGARFVRAMS